MNIYTEPVQLHGEIIGFPGSSSDKQILQHFSSIGILDLGWSIVLNPNF